MPARTVLAAVATFLVGLLLLTGCGDSAPTAGGQPSEKQKLKEGPGQPGPGGDSKKK